MALRTQLPFYGLYIGQFAFLGVQLPFLSGWLAQAGFSVGDVGLITGAALVVRIISGPLVGVLADQTFSQKQILQFVALLMLASALGVAFFTVPVLLAIACTLMLVAFGILLPVADIALTRAERAGLSNFGFVRASGSAAFIVMNIIAGFLIDGVGYKVAVLTMCMAALAALLSTQALPSLEPAARRRQRFSLSFIQKLISNHAFIVFLIAVSAIQASHAFYYAFSILHWRSIGISASVIGILWSTGVVVEVLVLTRTKKLHSLFTPEILIGIGGAAAFIRWSLTSFEPSIAGLFVIQTLHSLTFASTYLGTIQFLRQAVPDEMSNTAMTMTSTLSVGAATGLATILAGLLYTKSGAPSAYLFMGFLGLLGVLFSLILKRLWRGGLLPIAP